MTIQTILVKRAPSEKKSTKRSESIEGYQLQLLWQRNPDTEQKLTEQLSRFILATNQLDSDEHPAPLILNEYKHQQKVERGFRFFKDPLFFVRQEDATGRSLSVSDLHSG